MDELQLDLPPVGIQVLPPTGAQTVPVYQGVSYCDALRRAGEGETLRILPGSIRVCRWAPVVLGMKEPEGRFEENLAPRLAFPIAGLLLAPLDRFPGKPEVVVVRARPEVLQEMIHVVGPLGADDRLPLLWDGHQDRLDRSAIPLLAGERVTLRRELIGAVNRMLAALARSVRWQTFTRWLFRSNAITAGFDALISRSLADMSVCRNSTVLPLLTGCVNVSFFCTGGITWGGNHPEHLTSGWPWSVLERLRDSSFAIRRRSQ